MTTGSNNTLVGALTDTSSVTQTNSTALGYGAKVDADNTIQLGNASVVLVKTSGNVLSAAAPTLAGHLTNKTYVDSKVMSLNNQSLNTTDTVAFGGIKLSTNSVLNFYEQLTHTTVYSGPALFTPQSIYFTRIGALVTMTLGGPLIFTATSNTYLLANTPIPTQFRPTVGQHVATYMTINDQPYIHGLASISFGNLKIYKANNGFFQIGEKVRIESFSATWALAS